MKHYQNLLRLVLDHGIRKSNRTSIATYSVIGTTFRHDLALGFPLLTTKRVFWNGVVAELIWFLSGSTNVKPLQAQGVTIWDEWADDQGELGPVYGKQWVNWAAPDGSHINQIANLVHDLRNNPNSRRHIVTAWNPADVPHCKLPPCHCFFQCFVVEGKLSLLMYMRSADLFLGVPFNIASYALLLVLLCSQTGLRPGELIVQFGDLHLYENHLDATRLQLTREPMELLPIFINNYIDFAKDVPHLAINPAPDIFSVTRENIDMGGYKSHPAIKAAVAV